MATAPIAPEIAKPQAYELPSYLGTLGAQSADMQASIVQSRKQARQNAFEASQGEWAARKLSDKDYLKRLDDLVNTSDGITDRKQYELYRTQAKSSIAERNLTVEKLKVDALSYKPGVNGMDVYNQYSRLSRTAAQLGFTELSATLLVEANQMLKRLQAEAKASAAEAKAAREEAAMKKLQEKYAKSLETMYGTPTTSPTSNIPSGGMATPQGYIIPEKTAEGGFITAPMSIAPKVPMSRK